MQGWLACALLTALAGCTAGHPAPALERGSIRPPSAVHLALRPYFRGLRTVEMRIGDAAFTLLVDTAGGRTLLTPNVAAKLGCMPRGREVGYRMNGDSVAFRTCPDLRASISGMALHLAPFAVFDIAALLPKELPALDGVLALDAFRGQVVTLDWERNEIVVSGDGDGVPPGAVPLRFATGETGGALSVLLPVQGALDRMWFLLDSGNVRGTLLDRHAVSDEFVTIAADSTVRLTVGNTAAEVLPVIVDDINFDGVLGTHYLQAHAVTLDLRGAPQ